MTYEVVSVLCGGQGPQQSFGVDADPRIHLDGEFDNRDNAVSPCVAYDVLLDESWLVSKEQESAMPRADVLMYIHDDVTIHEPNWRSRVMSIFESHPDCVCVGFGGAPQLAHDDFYKTRYQIANMARQGYVSNQTDWQTHGGQEKGQKRVAVVDAFFMAVRTDFLRGLGGWPVGRLTHHCLDLWIACEAARHGKEVWMCGVSCTHHGGGSSTKPAYKSAKWLQGRTLESDHSLPHRWLYSEYKDVLPIKVKS